MSSLPRPDLPPGPHRDLVTALHDLHHRAGWPSLRTLARETGVSHTTVSKAMSHPALPAWGTVELLVEAMGGSTDEFHGLWLAASTPTNGTGPSSPRIAGRKAELAAVRRHLEAGTGLLLVTGEAGIGKTSLVTAAAVSSNAFVAVGRCRPLSTEVPLLPVLDCLHDVHDSDSEWFARALKGCAAYVSVVLAPLLPDAVERTASSRRTDERHLLLASVSAILRGLAEIRPFALLIVDLHWADSTTLDLLEHLLGRGTPVPVVGTWRTADDTTTPPVRQWFSRVRRQPGVHEQPLGALTREETSDQLAMLGALAADRLELKTRSVVPQAPGLKLGSSWSNRPGFCTSTSRLPGRV